MTAEKWVFVTFVMSTATVVVAAVLQCRGKQSAILLLAGMAIWFVYVVMMSHLGILQRSNSRPPGMLFILGPVIFYLGVGLAYVNL